MTTKISDSAKRALMDRIDAIEKYGKASPGKKFMLQYLNGGRLTSGQAIKANCFICMGYYSDGRVGCKMPTCPLYQFMPYRKRPV